MTKLMAEIEYHAGGAWEGHVWFLARHPITKQEIKTNSFPSVKKFCEEQNLVLDPDIYVVLSKLELTEKYGFIVPLKFIEKHTPWSSASNYLRGIRKELEAWDVK